MTFGNAEGEKPPSWVPTYPGGRSLVTASQKTAEGFTGHYSFQTADPTEKVLSFYERELKAAGFAVERTAMQGMVRLANLNAKADGGKRTVNVIITPVGEMAQVAVQYAGVGSSE